MIHRERQCDWTKGENDILRQNVKLSAKELLPLLPNRTEGAIKNHRSILGIGPDGAGSRKRWTEEEVKFLREHSHRTYYWIAQQIGRSHSSVSNFMKSKRIAKEYRCLVCSSVLSQQGTYCLAHMKVGKKVRFYRSRMSIKYPDSNLNDEDVIRMVMGECHYCGGNATGIDRVDSSKGYTTNNTVACCSTCNFMKSDLNYNTWIEHMKKVLSNTGEIK